MIPLLAQLGIALVGGIMQKKEQEAALENARHQHAGQVEMDIAAKRASRAGDSGYMQQALGGAAQMPKRPPSVMPGVVAGMAGALLGYNGGSDSKTPGAWKDSGTPWTGGGSVEDAASETLHEAQQPGSFHNFVEDENKYGQPYGRYGNVA